MEFDSMGHILSFIKYPILVLALLPIVMGGHLFCCAHWQYHDESSECSSPTNGYQETPYDREQECNGSGQSAVTSSRNVNEMSKLLPLSVFIFVVAVTPSFVTVGWCDTVSVPLSLRPHLFYGVLLL